MNLKGRVYVFAGYLVSSLFILAFIILLYVIAIVPTAQYPSPQFLNYNQNSKLINIINKSENNTIIAVRIEKVLSQIETDSYIENYELLNIEFNSNDFAIWSGFQLTPLNKGIYKSVSSGNIFCKDGFYQNVQEIMYSSNEEIVGSVIHSKDKNKTQIIDVNSKLDAIAREVCPTSRY